MSAFTIFCELLALSLVIVGIIGLIHPEWLSHNYGLHARESVAHGYVRAAAIRDVVIGAALGIAAYAHVTLLVDVLLAAGVVLAIADLTIVHRASGKRFHWPHAAGAVAFLVVLAMALFAIGK